MSILRVWWIALLVLATAGCGSASPPPKPPAAPVMVKAALQEIAASGEFGSGVEELERQLEAMKATDPAKANALLADYKELRSLRNSQAIKTKAKAMVDKL